MAQFLNQVAPILADREKLTAEIGPDITLDKDLLAERVLQLQRDSMVLKDRIAQIPKPAAPEGVAVQELLLKAFALDSEGLVELARYVETGDQVYAANVRAIEAQVVPLLREANRTIQEANRKYGFWATEVGLTPTPDDAQ